MIGYISTRGDNNVKTASEAILEGIAPDGGLYVPTSIPKIDMPLKTILKFEYIDLAYHILKLYLTDFTEEELRDCISEAYSHKFDNFKISPLIRHDGAYFLELFHGPTLAFKDMALSLLPYLMKVAAVKNKVDKKIVILAATSGDTGKAALEGFKNVDGIDIIVFYPQDGVSRLQKLQMVTQEGENVKVAGIDGNFDDAQTAVKSIFTDRELTTEFAKSGFVFSSANSINIGRLIPQIVYYFYAYAQMVHMKKLEPGVLVNVVVPTGNFGNILAAYYAKEMGLPIKTLVCASNENKVLTDFFNTGEYNTLRKFIATSSPSMDILISSNLERLLYHVSNDQAQVAKLMNDLQANGKYNFDITNSGIVSEYATEAESFYAIKNLYKKSEYVIDTHTAVAYASYKKYVEKTNDKTKSIIVSTASPFKFAKDVLSAIDKKYKDREELGSLIELSAVSGVRIPDSIEDIHLKPILHKDIISKAGIKEYVRSGILGDVKLER